MVRYGSDVQMGPDGAENCSMGLLWTHLLLPTVCLVPVRTTLAGDFTENATRLNGASQGSFLLVAWS